MSNGDLVNICIRQPTVVCSQPYAGPGRRGPLRSTRTEIIQVRLGSRFDSEATQALWTGGAGWPVDSEDCDVLASESRAGEEPWGLSRSLGRQKNQ